MSSYFFAMIIPRLSRLRRHSQGLAHRGLRVGFGRVIESEIALLRMLNSVPASEDIAEQRKVVTEVIATLSQCLQQLPMPARFRYLERVVRLAGSEKSSRCAPPTRESLRQANAELARKLCDAHAPTARREEWESALLQAAVAHRELASTVRWKRSPQ